MKQKIVLIIVIVLILVVVSIGATYSFFGFNIIKEDINDFNVSSGKVDLKIDDTSINASDITPIYDDDYKLLSYNKDFSIISSSSLNACSKLYIRIDDISSGLKSKYFKYKIVYDGVEKDGNFEHALKGEDLLILDNLFINSNETKYFDLYIWVSYQDDVDQMDMLSSKLKASLVVKGVDAKNNYSCN